MVHGGMTLVKYLLFLFNFFFWVWSLFYYGLGALQEARGKAKILQLSGIAIIVAGTVIQIKYSQYINFLGSSFLSAPMLLIVVGVIVAFLGFFGCCGAIRENYCMTMTFAVLLGVIFILELAAGIASYVLRLDVEDIVMGHTKQGMGLYNRSGSEGVSLAWDRLQRDFACCGADDYADWANNTLFRESRAVPASCCRPTPAGMTPPPACAAGVLDLPREQAVVKVFDQGCAEQLKDWVVTNVAIVGGTGVGVAFIQVLGICFACCLSKSILKEYEDYYY